MVAQRLLEGQVALVTGASRGIGEATARLFVEHGAMVAVNYLSSAEEANSLVAQLCQQGGTAIAVQADVRDAADVQKAVQQVERQLGPIDILVLNAGKTIKWAPVLDYKWEDLQNTVLAELKGAFNPVHSVAPKMVARKRGAIIAVTSTASRQVWEGSVAHSAAKAALDSYIRSLAFELGQHNIRVNLVAPGFTLTHASAHTTKGRQDAMARLTPLRRNAEPEDVAGAILAVASTAAGFVHGQYIAVNGGIQMF